jgi:hypothetical protein
VVLEVYESSNAVLHHVGGLVRLFGQPLEVGAGCRFEGFGGPSPELVEATAALDVSPFSSQQRR